MQCNTDKNEIRLKMKKLRRNLTSKSRKNLSDEIYKRLFGSGLLENKKNICVYTSAFGEVETYSIIKKLLKEEKNVFVPCIDGEDIFLSKFSEQMQSAAFGIKEPTAKELVDKQIIDAFLIPALAFDRFGTRVGFGCGYYDKLLSGTNAIKIGLIYSFQLTNKIEGEAHDMNADYLITEKEVINCGIQRI